MDGSSGDKIEIWQGASATWENILGNENWYDMEYERGTLALRGFIFSILRKSRVRVTYRYGGEDYSGDTVIPYDVEDAVVKMTAIEILNTSFRMDELPSGGMSNTSESKRKWEEDVEKCIENRREIFVIP